MLTTKERILKVLGGCNTNVDEVEKIEFLIKSASAFIKKYCNKNFQEVKEIEQTIKGNKQTLIATSHTPIISITDCHSYYKFTDTVIYLNCQLPRGNFHTIKYRAGYETVPADIEQACIELVIWKYRLQEHIDLVKVAQDGATTEYLVSAIPNFIRAVLDEYKESY